MINKIQLNAIVAKYFSADQYDRDVIDKCTRAVIDARNVTYADVMASIQIMQAAAEDDS